MIPMPDSPLQDGATFSGEEAKPVEEKERRSTAIKKKEAPLDKLRLPMEKVTDSDAS